MSILHELFSLEGHTAIVSGGAGAIGSVMSETLLKAGANVIMPNLTPILYRALYQIYPNTFYQSPEELNRKIIYSIAAAGRVPGMGKGDRYHHGMSQIVQKSSV